MSSFRPYDIKTIDATQTGIVKDVDRKSRTVTGYFSTFNFKDSDGDIIVATAFDKTIAERGPDSARQRIMHLWQHDSFQPLSKPRMLKADGTGLYFESVIADTTLGNDILALYEGGVITEHSIGFNTILTETDEETQTTYIKEARLWEGSSVTWGANEMTPFTGFKSLMDSPEKVEKHVKSIFKALRNSPISDETAESLEIWVNQLLTAIKAVPPVADNRMHEVDVHSPDVKSGSVVTLEQTADMLSAIFAAKTIEQTFQRKNTK